MQLAALGWAARKPWKYSARSATPAAGPRCRIGRMMVPRPRTTAASRALRRPRISNQTRKKTGVTFSAVAATKQAAALVSCPRR